MLTQEGDGALQLLGEAIDLLGGGGEAEAGAGRAREAVVAVQRPTAARSATTSLTRQSVNGQIKEALSGSRYLKVQDRQRRHKQQSLACHPCSLRRRAMKKGCNAGLPHTGAQDWL